MKKPAEKDYLSGIEYWTSGTDQGCDDTYLWCAGKKEINFVHKEVNWRNSQRNSADGDCTFVKFSNKNANDSTYALANCAQQKQFICEVASGCTTEAHNS
jgi:hypothetical protein